MNERHDNPLGDFKVVEINGYRILVGQDSGTIYVPAAPTKPFWYARWEPTPQMIEFFRAMLAQLNWLSIWQVPATGSVYSIDKERKTLTLIKGQPDEWHWKNVKTLGKLGYRVLVVQEGGTGSGKIERKPQ